ncbi:MAG: type II secretion system protein [Clostridiales bacterium]|nr:type II secretion system protein [Clostridiales bacterium]
MTKARNNKAGFTLIEMVLVVAIITILGTVLISGLVAYIQLSEERAGKVAEHEGRYAQANDKVALQLKTSYSDIKSWKDPDEVAAVAADASGTAVIGENPGADPDPVTPDPTPDPVTPEPTEAVEPSEPEVTEPETTEAPDPTPEPTDPPKPSPKPEPIEPDPGSSNGLDGVNLGAASNLSGTVVAGSSTDVSVSSNQFAVWERPVSNVSVSGGGKNIYSVTVKVEGTNVTYKQNDDWKYNNVENMGNNTYKFTYTANSNDNKPDSGFTAIFMADGSVKATVVSVALYNN